MRRGTYMQSDIFESFRYGQIFRFYPRGELAYGLKGYLVGGEACALVLTPTKAGLRPGDLMNVSEVGPAMAVDNVKFVLPVRGEGIFPGAGNIAQPAEIEIRCGGMIFVTQPQDRGNLILRVDLESGGIGRADGERPTEIYSCWSLVRANAHNHETIYEHKPLAQAA